MRDFILLKLLLLVTLIHVSECRLRKRTFQIRRSKVDELAPNKYANECGKFKYFTQIVISLFYISYSLQKSQIISKIQ
jgi:hypothetical protein